MDVARVLEADPLVLRLGQSSANQARSISDQDQPRAHLRSVTSRRVHCIDGRNATAAPAMLEREAGAASLHGDRLRASIATINFQTEHTQCSIEEVF
jgi:hypothetical protein